MLSVLRRPRWAGLALVIVAVSVLCVGLGRWQWHRHEDRRAQVVTASAALAQPPQAIDQVMAKTDGVPPSVEYRTVVMSGTYDAENQILWRNPRGRSGFSVITPLVPDQGPALLVERGWTAFSPTDPGQAANDVAPPDGVVEVTARLRVDQPADDRTPPAGQTYAIDSRVIGADLPYAVYPGYGELVSQEPTATDDLEPPETDTPGLGPHLLYAYQWWFFAILALVGYVLLVRREAEEQTVAAAEPVDPADAAPADR